MANTRIKDISKTATSIASDDYLALDGATNGSRKMVRSSVYTDLAAAFVAQPTTYKLAPLNSVTNKIEATYLPTSGDTPKGEWNANTNSPTLIDGTGTAGDYYDVTTAGSQNLGSGSVAYTVGDVVKYNGSTWYKIDSVSNIFDGVADAVTGRSTLSVHSVDEDYESIATVLRKPELYYNGTSSFTSVAYSAKTSFTDGTDDTPFTVAARIRTSDLTSCPIVAKWGTSAPAREWRLNFDSSDKLTLVLIDTNGFSCFRTATTALTGYEGDWVHVCATYGGSGATSMSGTAFTAAGDEITLYVNGSLVASTATNNSGGNYTGMTDGTNPVWIGKFDTTLKAATIGDVQIFNRELTAAEVATIARSGNLGYSDEWAGANGGIYSQPSSAQADWTSTNGADADNAGPLSSVSNFLTYTLNTTSGLHYIERTLMTIGKRYRVEFDYYIPSTNSNADGIRAGFNGNNDAFGEHAAPTLDQWNRFNGEAIATTTTLLIFAEDGGTTSFQDAGGDDVVHFSNITVTEIGATAVYLAENYIDSKLHDLSSNKLIGTGTSLTLVGGHKGIQIDTDAAAAGNKVISVYDGTNHLAYVTDKGNANFNSISSGASTELTIATGAVTATKTYHTIDTEGDAASDDLDTISGGRAGQLLVVQANNGARTVVLKDGTGNLKLSGDISLDNNEDTATLISDGTNWYLLASSNNGA